MSKMSRNNGSRYESCASQENEKEKTQSDLKGGEYDEPREKNNEGRRQI
jgi:hypothetical protein